MTTIPRRRILLTLCCLLLLAQASTADVPRIQNPAAPAEGVLPLRMTEQWRVGGEDHLIGLTTKVCTDADGRVHVMDSQLNRVLVFSPDGTFSHTLFREGEGPGEVRQPRDLFLLDDGRVGAIQEFPGATIYVDAHGQPAGRIRAGTPGGELVSLIGCRARGAHLLMSGLSQSSGDDPSISHRTFFLSSFGDDGREIHRFCESQAIYDFGDFKYSEREHIPTFLYCFDVGADGRCCVAPDRDASAIHVFSPDGRPERIIEREYAPLDRADREYEELRRTLHAGLSVVPIDFELSVEKRAAAIPYFQRGLHLREDGSIWALSGRGIRDLPDGVFAVFDVFDPEGVFVRQVELRGPGDALEDGIFFDGDDRLLVVEGYMDSMLTWYAGGVRPDGDDEDAGSGVAVICYELNGRMWGPGGSEGALRAPIDYLSRRRRRPVLRPIERP